MNDYGLKTISPFEVSPILQNWWCENRLLFLSILLIGLFSFGYELCNFTFSLNEEDIWMLRPDYNRLAHAGNSRWAMFVYEFLLPGIKYPFVSCALALLFLAFGYTLYLSTWKNIDLCGKVVFGSIAISCPIWAHMQEFSFMSAQTACSMMLSIVASLLVIHSERLLFKIFIPIFLLVFSIFTYQSLVLLFFAPYAIDTLITSFSKKQFKIFVYMLFVAVIAVVMYYFIDKILFYITDYEKSNYLDSYIGWFQYSIKGAIKTALIDLKHMFTNVFITWQYFYLLFIPICIYLLSTRLKFGYLVALCIVIGLYCSLWTVFGNRMNSRMLLYIPFMFSGVFFGAYVVSGKYAKILICCLAVYITLASSSINTQLFMMDTVARERDNILTSCVMSRLYSVYPNYLKDADKIAFVGGIKEEPIIPYTNKFYMEGFGMSSWSGKFGGDPWILYGFLKSYGVALPDLATGNEIKGYEKNIADMPSWPAPGCMKIFDKILFIKLS